MKNIILHIELVVMLIMICNFESYSSIRFKNNHINKDHYKYIKEVTDGAYKSYAFSRIAKPGKITLFIISAHWCEPCYTLKHELDDALDRRIINPDEVEIYSYMVSRSSNDGLMEMNKLSGYRQLKNIDKLTEVFPTTYIVAPTTNCYAIVPGAKYDEIIKNIQDLSEAKRIFFDMNSMNFGSIKVPAVPNKLIDSFIKIIKESDIELDNIQSKYIKKIDSLKEIISQQELRKANEKAHQNIIIDSTANNITSISPQKVEEQLLSNCKYNIDKINMGYTQFKVNTNDVAIRKYPAISGESTIISTVKKGKCLGVICQSKEKYNLEINKVQIQNYWYEVKDGPNVGWVYGYYLDCIF